MQSAVLLLTTLAIHAAIAQLGNAATEYSDGTSFDYSGILSMASESGITFGDLPGFTRSVYERDHALITPESRVWAPLPGWTNCLTAHLISPASSFSTNFAMYLVKMAASSKSAPPPKGVERFVFVLDGAVSLSKPAPSADLHADDYVYFPPDHKGGLQSVQGAGLLIYERKYTLGGAPELQYGATADSAVLETPGEVFALRKLMPATSDYDFNIHVMDFQPGQYLNVKEVHYNQHGLLLLQGQGIYRLGDKWYPVQAGDAIWMPPYVPQWYAALGTRMSRYIIIKDTIANPLLL